MFVGRESAIHMVRTTRGGALLLRLNFGFSRLLLFNIDSYASIEYGARASRACINVGKFVLYQGFLRGTFTEYTG